MTGAEGFFVDSNVILYYVDPRDVPKQAHASEWLEALWTSGSGRLSWQVLHEFYWNAVKKMQLDALVAREMVDDLAQWKPVDTSQGLIKQAWHWMDAAQLSYWDALIVAAAQRSGSRFLLSEDFQSDRKFDEVQVVNPFQHQATEFLSERP
jgi:predicted nucleic acid-binding protein